MAKFNSIKEVLRDSMLEGNKVLYKAYDVLISNLDKLNCEYDFSINDNIDLDEGDIAFISYISDLDSALRLVYNNCKSFGYGEAEILLGGKVNFDFNNSTCDDFIDLVKGYNIDDFEVHRLDMTTNFTIFSESDDGRYEIHYVMYTPGYLSYERGTLDSDLRKYNLA